MVNLPADFVAETRRIMGDERYNRFVGAFDEEAPTSIRVNPRIAIDHGPFLPCKPAELERTILIVRFLGAARVIISTIVLSSPSIPYSMPAATTYKRPPLCS